MLSFKRFWIEIYANYINVRVLFTATSVIESLQDQREDTNKMAYDLSSLAPVVMELKLGVMALFIAFIVTVVAIAFTLYKTLRRPSRETERLEDTGDGDILSNSDTNSSIFTLSFKDDDDYQYHLEEDMNTKL